MILKALYDYYFSHQTILPPIGMEFNEISFLIVINDEGNFIELEDCRKDNGRGSEYQVPRAVDRSSQIAPNMCWDNYGYILGLSNKGIFKKDSIEYEKYLSFKEQIHRIYSLYPQNQGLKALNAFYEKNLGTLIDEIKKDVLWKEFSRDKDKKISFKLRTGALKDSLSIIADNDDLQHYLENDIIKGNNNDKKDICLITGQYGPIAKTIKATPIHAKEAKAKIVSFQKDRGYDSFGKIQCSNAPISKIAEFAFTTAINYLLRADSKHRYDLVDRVYVFWSSSHNGLETQLENCFLYFLNSKPHLSIENNSKEIIEVFQSVFSGKIPIDSNDYFYLLGLAPNKTREYVVLWKEIPVRDFAENILQHFQDMEIVDYIESKDPYRGLYQIATAISLKSDIKKIRPNLLESTIKSVFQGSPYPYALYTACLQRIRAEHIISYNSNLDRFKENKLMRIRAAIIKAYLNRKSNNYKKLSIMLDPSNTNVGYVCGRLFATLEYLQYKSSGIDSIRQRYLNAASTTPATVFGNLMNLSAHHEEKLNAPSLIFFKRLKNEIVDLLSAEGFPAHLDIQDQGRFFVGYHHQMAEFFRKKETEDSNENLESE